MFATGVRRAETTDSARACSAPSDAVWVDAATCFGGSGSSSPAPEPAPDAASWSLNQMSWDPFRMVAVQAAHEPRSNAGEALMPTLLASGKALDDLGNSPPPKKRAYCRRPQACQMSGCDASLSGYQLRARLCDAHMRASVLHTPAGLQRFCQKCHTLHCLAVFSGERHACIASLEKLSARRFARRAAAATAVDGGGSDSIGTGTTAASEGTAAVLDSGCAPQNPSAAEDSPWPAELLDLFSSAAELPDSSASGADDELPPLLLFATPGLATASPSSSNRPVSDEVEWAWPLPLCATLELKLAGDTSPTTLFPPCGLRSELLSTLEFTPPPLQAHAAVRPGCTLLSVDMHALPPGGGAYTSPVWRQNAERLLAAFLARPSSFVARQAAAAAQTGRPGVRLTLRGCGIDGSSATARSLHSAVSSTGWRALFASVAAVAATPDEDHSNVSSATVSPLAVLSTRNEMLYISSTFSDAGAGDTGADAANASCRMWVRINGQYLSVTQCAAGGAIAVTLPASGATGCALVDVDCGAASSRKPLHPVLLCADASIVAELTATEAVLLTRSVNDEERARLKSAVWALGCALSAHATPHVVAATPSRRRVALAAAGAAASIRYGWPSALCACLRALQAAADDCDTASVAGAVLAPNGSSLLHQAAAAGDAQMLEILLLHAPPKLRGRATSRDATGATPLHIAARAGAVVAVRALCDTTGGGHNSDAVADAADAVVAWLCALDNTGTAPSGAMVLNVPGFAELDATLRARATAGIAYARTVIAAADPAEYGFALPAHAVEFVSSALTAADAAAENAADTLHVAQALLRQLMRAIKAREARADDASTTVPAPPGTGVPQPPSPGASTHLCSQLHAYRSTLLLIVLINVVCAFTRMRMPALDDTLIRASLPAPPWHVWQRTPTVMCCGSGLAGAVPLAREVALTLFALAGLVPWRGAARVLRDKYVVILHAALIFYFLLLDVSLCALVTHSRFGAHAAAAGGPLRMPWQGGLKQLILSAAMHFSTEMRLPPGVYAVLMGVRGALPLLVRAAEAGHTTAWWERVAHLRLLPVRVGWDVAHAALAFACVVHNAAAHRRRKRAQAKAKSL